MDIAHRFQSNPILSPAHFIPATEGMEIACLLNPGVFRFQNKTWLLLRVAERPIQAEGKICFSKINANNRITSYSFDKNDPKLDVSDPRIIVYDGEMFLTTLSYLRLVCSEDGIHFIEPEGYEPIFSKGNSESFGIEDCRVAQMDEKYYLTYTQVSANGVGVGLMTTSDWKTFERKGMIFPPHNKDCALFEEKINSKYYALHRPSSPELGGNYIWLAESPDMEHWGNHRCIATTRKSMWDSARIGAGASPIKTTDGWLEIYHGANKENQYSLGALLLDLNDPSRVIARSETPVMTPSKQYELTGFFGNVIFTNGHIVDKDTITMYYGASDEVICGATFSIKQIMDTLSY